jgi:hypothetical protein
MGQTPMPKELFTMHREGNPCLTDKAFPFADDGPIAVITCRDGESFATHLSRRWNSHDALLAALKRIAEPHACGCKPCVGQCTSQESLSIEIEEIRDLARVALSRTIASSGARER